MKFKFFVFFLITIAAHSQQLRNSSSHKPKFFAIVNVGPSLRTAKTQDGLSAEEKKYIKELKSGLSYDLGFYYQKNDISGFGLKYNAYTSKGKGFSNDLGNFGDNIKITFIGATMFVADNEDAKVGEVFLEVGLGYIGYKNDSYINTNDNIKFTGGNLGLDVGAGYHFRIGKHFLIGPQIAFIGGVLKKIKVEYPDGTSETINLGKEELESLYRFDFNVSAKIRF